LRRYRLQPQKVSLPGPSDNLQPKRLRLLNELKRLSGQIGPEDAKEFQTISDKLGDEDIKMNLLVDDEARFTIMSTLEANAQYSDLYLLRYCQLRQYLDRNVSGQSLVYDNGVRPMCR
jgi:hypothetical protein